MNIQKGNLVVADITGYTAFLTQVELEHSREILDTLLRILVEKVEPPLIISKLEGDAVFAYTQEGSFVAGQSFVEALERLYFAFRTARDTIYRSCQCQACTLASELDLKILGHYGLFSLHTIGTMQELQGADVITVHRLLKNEITQKTGMSTYIFFTAASAEGIPLGALTQTMSPYAETYEHLGEVHGYLYDLRQAWERERERRRVTVDSGNVWAEVAFELPVSPSLAWDYLNHPSCICEWCVVPVSDIQVTNLKHGRLGIGSGRHCIHAHGKEVTIDTILDYQPFDYVTVETTHPNGTVMRSTTEFIPNEYGTHVVWRSTRPVLPKGGLAGLATWTSSHFTKSKVIADQKLAGENLRQLIDSDIAAGKVPMMSIGAGNSPDSS